MSLSTFCLPRSCGLDRHRGRVAVGWPDRILREQVEDVREQKLLVPPLVVASELDQLRTSRVGRKPSKLATAWSTCARYT
jgi:hypothetical protein